MRTNTANLRNLAGVLDPEKGIPIPYDTGELATFFHRDAIILLTLSEMLQGDSVLFPRGYTTQDMQRLVPATFPHAGMEAEMTRADILEQAFRKALADKFYIGSAQHKLTLDAEAVTTALDNYVKQVTDGFTDHPGITRHSK